MVLWKRTLTANLAGISLFRPNMPKPSFKRKSNNHQKEKQSAPNHHWHYEPKHLHQQVNSAITSHYPKTSLPVAKPKPQALHKERRKRHPEHLVTQPWLSGLPTPGNSAENGQIDDQVENVELAPWE